VSIDGGGERRNAHDHITESRSAKPVKLATPAAAVTAADGTFQLPRPRECAAKERSEPLVAVSTSLMLTPKLPGLGAAVVGLTERARERRRRDTVISPPSGASNVAAIGGAARAR
jgi:hypothetical protein